jgi:hypothetical protein
MPRIPRRWKGDEQAAAPEEQRTDGHAPSTDPATQQMTVGAPAVTPPDPVAGPAGEAQGDATSASAAGPAGEAQGDATSGSDTTSIAVGDQPTVAADPLEPPTVVDAGDPLAPAPQGTAETGELAADGEDEQGPADARPRFRRRTRMRRRLRYLRRLRELAFRDLGGLVFDLHRFGRERGDLVAAKLEALGNIDRELRALQESLGDRRDFTDLREAGIAACPRCGTLHDTDANFCPGCGTSLRTAIVRDAAPVTVTAADEPRTPPAQTEPQQPTAAGS